MSEAVFIVLGLLILVSFLLVMLLIFFNRKYRSSLVVLLDALPQEKYEELKHDSKDGIGTVKRAVIEAIKAQFKEPNYIITLLTTLKYTSGDSELKRRVCEKWFKRYKLTSYVVMSLFLGILFSTIGIYIAYKS